MRSTPRRWADARGVGGSPPRLPASSPRRAAAQTLLALLLAPVFTACGGGGSGASAPPADPATQSTRETRSITSRFNGNTYPLNIFLPPASAGPRASMPVVYALDGDTWFEVLASIAETARPRVIIVGIGNSQLLRNSDFVPINSCTPGGGGQAAFFEFLRQELTPYIDATLGGHPTQRALLGHSHGGAMVLYSLFSQAPGQHHFSAYLASDASIACMPDTAYGWERAYAARYTELPTRLHVSMATLGNLVANQNYLQALEQRHYQRLLMSAQVYGGTHTGIIPAAFADAIAFAFAFGLGS